MRHEANRRQSVEDRLRALEAAGHRAATAASSAAATTPAQAQTSVFGSPVSPVAAVSSDRAPLGISFWFVAGPAGTELRVVVRNASGISYSRVGLVVEEEEA